MPIMPPRDLFEVTWDDYGNERLPDLTTYNDVRNDINGYTSTETMTDGSNWGGSGGYEFLWRLEQIRNYDSQASQYPADIVRILYRKNKLQPLVRPYHRAMA